MNTKVLMCTCKHDYQDKKYGKQMRAMNKTGAQNPQYRCTVCGATRGN